MPLSGESSNRSASESNAAPFRIDWLGRLLRHQVRLVWTDEPRPTTRAIDERIASTWLAEMELARRHARLLYNGPIARLVGATFTDDAAEFLLGPTEYRDFLGTNLRHAADVVSESGLESLSNALGVSILPITRDGFVTLGLRSGRVAQHAGMVHPFGGMVEADDGTPSHGGMGHPCPDLFAAAARELMEETGLRQDDFSPPVLIGLARDLTILQPEAIFETQTLLTRAELEVRFMARRDEEHSALMSFKVDAPHDAASNLIEPAAASGGKPQGLRLTPIAQAARLVTGT